MYIKEIGNKRIIKSIIRHCFVNGRNKEGVNTEEQKWRREINLINLVCKSPVRKVLGLHFVIIYRIMTSIHDTRTDRAHFSIWFWTFVQLKYLKKRKRKDSFLLKSWFWFYWKKAILKRRFGKIITWEERTKNWESVKKKHRRGGKRNEDGRR